MIIDRADNFGLAQLHQLRGRIGRSDRKAYAYFLLPPHKILSDTAQKRLHALEAYSEIGSGFHLASSDLEIRGAGDILGAEQSGHIDSIGLELYLELLQEAIHEIKGEKPLMRRNCEMQVPYPAFIPHQYITDQGTRLKYYKKLANSETEDQLSQIENELQDIFGLLPKETLSLFSIIRARNHFSQLGINLVKCADKNIYLYFDQEFLQNQPTIRDKIVQHFLSRPKLYKMNPDSSTVCYFKETLSQETLLEFSKHIAGQILVC